MAKVESEAMTDVEYNPASRTLRIRFTDGDWYSYFAVPASVHRALLAADSHGRYFQAHIRDRYRFCRG
jgi:hypothetical protein